MDLTSDNNTDPRRRKLSQARNLQEEGCANDPMRIDVSTENLSPRKALTLEMKQNGKFCTDVSDFLTKLEVCLQCPLSHQRYVDPVIGSDGYTYEEESITQWLSKKPESPLTPSLNASLLLQRTELGKRLGIILSKLHLSL